MTVTYRWAAPDTLDVITQVTPQKDMPGFEFFLSSYFADGFSVSVYLKPNRFEREAKPRWMPVNAHPLFDGNYMMFPRDRKAVLT
ncbi:MAG TPA: hypothetical protein EYP14_20805, partial [Planctomycetaceae bacterium]|nr:hypothetical protein [Planctomycetaceae bacterium]